MSCYCAGGNQGMGGNQSSGTCSGDCNNSGYPCNSNSNCQSPGGGTGHHNPPWGDSSYDKDIDPHQGIDIEKTNTAGRMMSANFGRKQQYSTPIRRGSSSGMSGIERQKRRKNVTNVSDNCCETGCGGGFSVYVECTECAHGGHGCAPYHFYGDAGGWTGVQGCPNGCVLGGDGTLVGACIGAQSSTYGFDSDLCGSWQHCTCLCPGIIDGSCWEGDSISPMGIDQQTQTPGRSRRGGPIRKRRYGGITNTGGSRDPGFSCMGRCKYEGMHSISCRQFNSCDCPGFYNGKMLQEDTCISGYRGGGGQGFPAPQEPDQEQTSPPGRDMRRAGPIRRFNRGGNMNMMNKRTSRQPSLSAHPKPTKSTKGICPGDLIMRDGICQSLSTGGDAVFGHTGDGGGYNWWQDVIEKSEWQQKEWFFKRGGKVRRRK